MSSDFRKSANNTNSKQGGANSQPSSFQDKKKKPKSNAVAKEESPIKENLREGYKTYYSKYEDPLSETVKRIVRGDNFSPETIIAEVERTKKEKINELRGQYPGMFKDGDFSLSKIQKPSSGTINTPTQRIFRDLKSKEGDAVSVKAIEELAGLEYFTEHIKGLEEKVKMGEIGKKDIGKVGLENEIIDEAVKGQKINKPEDSNLITKKQEEETEKLKENKSKKTELEKKPEELKSTGSQATTYTEKKIEDSDDDGDDGDTTTASNEEKELADDSEEATENLKNIPNFDDKVEKIKKDKEASEEKQEAEKETVEMPIKEHIKEIENKDGSDELEEKIESYTRDENIKEFRKKMAADTRESRKSYEEAMKEIEGFAKEEGFEGLDIDRSGRSHISTNRYGFTKDSDDSSNWIKAEYDTPENKRVVIGEENLKNFDEWMQTDSKESKESIQDIFKHEAQHPKGPAKKSSNKESKEIKKRLEEEEIKIVKGEPAKTPSQITKEEHDKFYSGRDTQGRGYEMQTELQRINEDYKNIDDFIDTQARMKLGIDISNKGLGYISKNPYAPENADDILPVEHYNFIKPELKKKVVSRLEEMREDLADKYEIKKNKDNLKIFEEVLKNPASGGLDLAKKMQDNANAKIDFLTKKIDLRNEFRRLVKDEAEKTGKSGEDALLSLKESKEYQKNLLENKLNQINANIADSRFKDDPEKVEFFEEEKRKIIAEEKRLLLENESNLREQIGRTLSGLYKIKNSEESDSGKRSGIQGLLSFFEVMVMAYGKGLESNQELKKAVEDTRKLLKDSIESSEKIAQVHALPVFAPMPVSTPAPALPSAPHIPSRASAPQISASFNIPPSAPASSPQAPPPSQGPAKSSSSQGGKISTKSTPSTSPPSSSQTSPASSAPARSTPLTSATKTSLAPQTAAEPAPRSSPAPTPSQDSPAPVSPQTTDESAPTPTPAPSARHKASPARSSLSQGAVKPPINNQDNETSTEPMSQGPSVSSMPAPPQNSPVPTQTASEPVSTHTPASPSASAPSQASSIPTPAKTPSQLQSPEESSTDNTQKEKGGGMSKETIEEIKEKVRKQLEGSLEKNIDNGMGGIAIQDEAGRGDADKIKRIKNLAEQKNLNDQRNRISLINSAIKMDSARVDPAGREAETQRIRKEAEEKMEKEMRKEIGGVKGKIAAKVLSKVMGLAAYKMAQGLSQKADQGKGQLAFVVVVTLLLAIAADLIDIKRDAIVVLSAATIILFIFGAAAWLILLLVSSFLTATISMFWMQLAGGGHSKLMWRILIRNVFGIFLNSVPIFGDIPFTVIMVLWNWYDFAKERRKAKQELKTFVAKNKSLLRNVSAN